MSTRKMKPKNEEYRSGAGLYAPESGERYALNPLVIVGGEDLATKYITLRCKHVDLVLRFVSAPFSVCFASCNGEHRPRG
jgi:hypothetical protein